LQPRSRVCLLPRRRSLQLILDKPLAPLLYPVARRGQLLRDRLIIQARISQQDHSRPQGHPLLRFTSPEQSLDPLPLCNAQRYHILWT
jgi:hypothetical protein